MESLKLRITGSCDKGFTIFLANPPSRLASEKKIDALYLYGPTNQLEDAIFFCMGYSDEITMPVELDFNELCDCRLPTSYKLGQQVAKIHNKKE